MVLRVSAPGKPTRLIDLGVGHGEKAAYRPMRLPIDEAIAMSWAKGHPIGRRQ